MKPRVCRVDDDGLEVVGAFPGSVDVHFDGWRGWSAAIDRVSEEPFVVPWPKRLRPWLDGVSQVSVTHEGEQLFEGEVSFGSGTGRVELVDRHGTQIIIDKWGLQQRPFEVRRAGGAVEMMTQMAEQVLEVMRRDCGIDGWISFGTLLGAARSGAVIGHDSDIDLCFLSERATPAEMIAELWSIARALTDAGIQVKHKSASFITVVYEAPDGGMDGIDIYTCFYVGDLLYETATVRAPVPRSAIMPLRQLEFEGRLMPAPAEPDRMLTVSYGPGWKVPDPSFRHQPDRETTERFHDWFGSLMTHRRDWVSVNTAAAAKQDSSGSSFARWVTGQLEGRPACWTSDRGRWPTPGTMPRRDTGPWPTTSRTRDEALPEAARSRGCPRVRPGATSTCWTCATSSPPGPWRRAPRAPGWSALVGCWSLWRNRCARRSGASPPWRCVPAVGSTWRA
ncbi:hypothetical protein [Nocardioides houyundeii]|uniref:hypothetical protein n=1 Tax=Nocardioides houyundeii TaxID=2045452 RepID=UPI000C768403|nr:hypothetical protein [Nocardioides houyundeii]